MDTNWNCFKQAARREEPAQVPVALIVDSPWLPGFAGMKNTVDFFLDFDRWYGIHRGLLDRFPEAVWIPGFWVEYGMAAEPSAFGCNIHFHPDRPPSMEPLITDPAFWAAVAAPDVREAGFMPLQLRWLRRSEARLRAEGLKTRLVAARGPLVTAGWVMGVSDLMTGMVTQPDAVHTFLDTVTETIIRWLELQLAECHDPEGIFLLDDVSGMMGQEHFAEFAAPRLRRIFDAFDGMLKIFHNDMPCGHLFPQLAELDFDVFNFSHEVDIGVAKAQMGHRVALMGNVPPLAIGVRGTPEQVAASARECLDKAAPGGGMILSVGGGVSPGMPAENVAALLDAARDWQPPPAARQRELAAAAREKAAAEKGRGEKRSRRRTRRG